MLTMARWVQLVHAHGQAPLHALVCWGHLGPSEGLAALGGAALQRQHRLHMGSADRQQCYKL